MKLQNSKYPVKKLCELTDIARGSSPRPIKDQRFFESGTIPWIKIADATASGKYLYSTKQYVNNYGASFSRKLPAGSLIIAASGTLGYTQILGVEGCIHDGWLYFSKLEGVDRDFLYYTLQWLKQHFFNQASGAAIQNINTDILRNTEIPCPAMTLQQKIGTLLSTYDDLIENNNRRIAILEKMAQSLYREWFVKFRFPGYNQAADKPVDRVTGGPATPSTTDGASQCRMVDSPLGPIPEGWKCCSFTEVTDVLSGGTPKTTEPSYWGDEIPFFAPKDAPAHFYCLETEKQITELGLNKCSSKLYPKNTVFITARGTVGKVVLPACSMAMNQSCYALKSKVASTQRYLYLLTKSQVSYLKKNTGGATFDTIVKDTFERMMIADPPDTLKKEFEQLVSPFFDQILNLSKQSENLKKQRDLLLPKLISGQIALGHAEQATA